MSCEVLVFLAAFSLLPHGLAQSVPADQIQLQLNTEEAQAVLTICAKQKYGRVIEDSDWQLLFSTEPYIRLKRREAELHRDFADADFMKFVLSKAVTQRAPELQRTLEEWQKADLNAAATRVLQYLPPEARIRAKVFPVIKPQENSFVYELTKDPAIFLYLNPALNRQQFENTIAHELHHVGYASVASKMEQIAASLPPNVRAAVEWMGAFGEGFAMLAAAGGPDMHPHMVSPPQDRARWDHDLANFSQDLKTLEKFFFDIIEKRLTTEEEIQKVGFTFFGVQGPWYTVGWKMAVIVEKRFNRVTLIDCMLDPRKLLACYNLAAAELNAHGSEKLALWSPVLLKKIGAQEITDSAL
jgi:hypothetical protein